ncbi:MAG: reverse transcriptase domain-containing protein [Faecousia sp.]
MNYEALYQDEALERAFGRAMSGHRDDPEHAWYEANKIEALGIIQRKLAQCTYQPKPLRMFWVSEPKRRQVQAPSVADKIVQNALVDEILYDAITKPFIRDCYSCVIGRGTDDGLDRLKQFMAEAWRLHGMECWVLKADIHHYFASIDQKDIIRRAERYIPDKRVMELLCKYITLCPEGLPLGLRTSQPLANLELSWLDHKVKEVYRCRWYGRYMDDFYIIHPDRDFLRQVRREMDADLAAIGLQFNQKTQIFPVAHGIDFLGFRTYMTDTGKIVRQLRESSRKTMSREIKRYQAEYIAGIRTKEEIMQSYNSRRAHMERGNCRGLILKYDQEIKKIFA